MQPKSIERIVIAGGGTAGWMAASYLSNWLKNQDIKIVLVESEMIGTVGVGEATVPGIGQFINKLGIKESEFIKATNATFKLGIQFEGWANPETSFFHPFARYGLDLEGRSFYKSWWSAKEQGYSASLEEFCLCTKLALDGKFAQPQLDSNYKLAWYNYAYHFDASRFAKFLRSYSERLGVERIEGKISQVHTRAADGYIQSLQLESGQVVEGDLFVDCSGFRSLLMSGAMKVGFEDWSHWLPCDSALAVQTQSNTDPDSYTCSSARSAGWQWHIPLQHRAGNGYVFSSNYISQEQACDELLKNLRGEPLSDPRLIEFKAGVREKFWEKNCVAIGLASGFLEPLESTSISLIQTGIQKIEEFLVDYAIHDAAIEEANRRNRLEYERIRDFIILHYFLNGRSGPMWDYVRHMPIPDSLQDKLNIFRATGDIQLLEMETFVEASWVSMFNGFGVSPEGLPKSKDYQKLFVTMDKMRQAIQRASDMSPTHKQFLDTLP